MYLIEDKESTIKLENLKVCKDFKLDFKTDVSESIRKVEDEIKLIQSHHDANNRLESGTSTDINP